MIRVALIYSFAKAGWSLNVIFKKVLEGQDLLKNSFKKLFHVCCKILLKPPQIELRMRILLYSWFIKNATI